MLITTAVTIRTVKVLGLFIDSFPKQKLNPHSQLCLFLDHLLTDEEYSYRLR